MSRTPNIVCRLLVGAVAMAALAAPLHAQAGGASRAAPGAARQGGAPQGRIQLEREVRARIHDMMRQRMGLDDAQVDRLDATLRTFEAQRRALLREERDARMTLRAAMGSGAGGTASARPDDARISAALDTLLLLQRRRIDLAEAEQRELATFLTPLQRAQYFALQENLRRVMEGGAPAGAPGRPGQRRPPPTDGGGSPPR